MTTHEKQTFSMLFKWLFLRNGSIVNSYPDCTVGIQIPDIQNRKSFKLRTISNLVVVYFDQRTHACASVRMVQNDQKHKKIMEKVPFSSCTRETHVRLTKRNRWPTNYFLSFSSFFYASLLWASRAHDEKSTFLLIF